MTEAVDAGPAQTSPLRALHSRVGRRLLLWTLLFGGLGTLLVSWWSLQEHERERVADGEILLERLATQAAPTLASSLWAFDDAQVRRSLESLAHTPGVSAVRLQADGQGDWQLGVTVVSAARITRSVDVVFAEQGQNRRLGQLTLVQDLEPMVAEDLQRWMRDALRYGLVMLLSALGSVAIYHMIVTRRLTRLAGQLRSVTPEDLLRAPPPAPGPQRRSDELDELAASVATLQLTGHDALRRNVEQTARLQESEVRFHTIVQQAGEGIMLVDIASLRIVEANDAACRQLGHTREQLLALSIPEVATEFDVAGARRYFAGIGSSAVLDTRHRHRDGHLSDVQVSLSRMTLQGRECVLGVWRDVTQEKAAREAIQSAAEWHRALIHNTVEGVVIFDEQRRVIECNERFAEMIGYQAADLVGRTPEDWDAEMTPAQVRALVPVDGHSNLTYETRHRRRDGSEYDAEVSLQSATIAGRLVFVSLTRDISARVQAREALRAREALFSSIVSRAGDGIVLFDPVSGRFTEFNDQACQQLGLSREAFAVQAVAELLVEEAPGQTQALLARLACGEDGDVDLRLRHRDGTTREVSASHRLVQVGGRAMVAGVWRDMTERNAAEAVMREERRVRDLLMESVPGIAFAIDAEGRLVFWNQAFQRTSGFDADALRGRRIHTLFDPLHDAQVTHNTESALRRGSQSIEGTLLAADGSRHPFFFSSRAVEIDARQLLITTGVDISARRAAERALRHLNAELEERVQHRTSELQDANARLATTQFSMDEVGIGIHWVDAATGRFVWVNRAAAELVGVAVEDMLAMNVSDIDPGFPPEAFADISRRLREQGHLRFETTQQHRNGSRIPVEMTVRFHGGDPGSNAMLVGFVTDIRQRKAQERALQLAKDAAEAANLAKSAFLANMSHEIRTPLNAITGMAHLIRREGLTPRQGERMTKLQAAGEHLLSVLDAVLELSKIEAGKFSLVEEPVRVESLLGNVASMLHDRAAAKGLVLSTESHDMPPHLVGDATRLQQALVNYAGNAIKFTEKGRVLIRASCLSEDADGALLRFEVVDTGIGISAQALSRLFNAFEQADSGLTRKYGGTGLGLAITKKIAQLMGGDAGASSVPGQGSSFWFTARLAHAASVALDSAPMSLDPELQLRRSAAGCRVLLVEDEPINREVATELLTECGLEVDAAHDGSEAIAMARMQTYDLVLMDMQMPKVDGLQATREIRRLPGWAGRPIIAMTANAFEDDRRACQAAGMDDFLSKPVEATLLFEKVTHWLARSEALIT